ncbi:MAG: endonuclease III [Bacilli bacterium]|nr:endonuclease III [Bacilli bacterium]
MMKTDINRLLDYLDELFPSAKCELFYSKDYELVIAVMLSAQTTDKSVNLVTPILFKKYPSLDALNNAPLEDIEETIKQIGLYKNKAKNLKGIVKDLIGRFNYRVPSDKEELITLPGVGNKTAGVIRAEIFQIPDLPVDTHILRIAKRLNLAKKDDEPIDVERKLKKIIPEERWIKSHHQLIHFGRYFCTARSPQCQNCKISDMCINYRK